MNRSLLIAAGLLCLVVGVSIILSWYDPTHRRRTDVVLETASWDQHTPLVIVSSHFSEDLRWLQRATRPVVVCSKTTTNTNCSRIPNKGKEASAYLQFITQHYHRLPQRVAFIHGHERAWHQRQFDFLREIEKASASPCGYVSLNKVWVDDRNLDNKVMQHLHAIWDELFKPFLKRDPPPKLLHDCCAQFVVTRDTILRHPQAAYQKWLQYLLNSNEDAVEGLTGYVFEYVWHVIFGEPDIVTRPQHLNRCWKSS